MDWLLLIRLSILLQFGQRFWLLLLLVLVWPVIQKTMLLVGLRTESFRPQEVQNFLIGFPLYCLSIGIGIRVIAHEVEQRTLEVGYTICGGIRRIWISKLLAATLFLLSIQTILTVTVVLMFLPVTIVSFTSAFQGVVFMLIFSMWAGALVRNELSAVLISLSLGYLCIKMSHSPFSPFFNLYEVTENNAALVFEWSIKNHMGFLFSICILLFASFSRADNKDVMLAD